MNKKKVLWQAWKNFYDFSPSRQNVILLLMIAQGLTAGIGLLLIIPLLHVIGIGVGEGSNIALVGKMQGVLEPSGRSLGLGHVLVLYIAIVGAIASLRYWLTVNTAMMQQRYVCFLRNRLYRCLLNTRWQFIAQQKTSDFIHCLSGQVQAVGHASQMMLNLLSQLVLSVFMVGLAFMLSWKMSLLSIAFAAVVLCLLLPLNRNISGSGKRQLIKFKSLFQMLTEQLGSLKMIKSYSSESYYADRFSAVSEKLEAQQIEMTRVNAFTQWIYMVGAVVVFSLYFYISQNVFNTPLPTVLLLLVICSRLLPQCISMQKSIQQLLHKVPVFEDVRYMLADCLREQEVLDLEMDSKREPMVFKRMIRLTGVTFQYSGSDAPVIDNVSLEIKKKHTVALVGPSGAGKSTLADLIAGLLEPDNGEIYCDDRVLDNICRLMWRKSIAYVTQEVHLFHESVRDNLIWVAPSVGDDEIWAALNMAAADDFVRALPQGLETIIGDRGIRLSGGERQRIALARAILTKPQLLILDEATSALDKENEDKIHVALKHLQGKITIIIIAHRSDTLSHADQCVFLEKSNDQKDICLVGGCQV